MIVKNNSLNNEQLNKLIESAGEAVNNAYVPYSNFYVGAAVLTNDDSIFTGCNIENASYGLSICAERAAIFNAVSQGKTKIKALAVASHSNEPVYPCGACRQVLNEFADEREIDVYIISPSGIKKHLLSELLPYAFRLE